MANEMEAILNEILKASSVNTDSPTTLVNRVQDFLQLIGIPIEVLTGTYLEPERPAFNRDAYFLETDAYIASETPILADIAQGIKDRVYSRADARELLGRNMSWTEDQIKEFLDITFAELKEATVAEQQYMDEQIKANAGSIYGKAGLPERSLRYGFGPGEVPPPKSEEVLSAQRTAESAAQKIAESGLEQAVSGRDEALALGILSLIQNNQDKFFDIANAGDRATDNFYTDRYPSKMPMPKSSYGGGGFGSRRGVPVEEAEPTKRYSGGFEESRGTDKKVVENKSSKVEPNISNAAKNLALLAQSGIPGAENVLKIFLGASKALPGGAEKIKEVEGRYAKQMGELQALRALQGEQERIAGEISALDLLDANAIGRTPFTDAVVGRYLATGGGAVNTSLNMGAAMSLLGAPSGSGGGRGGGGGGRRRSSSGRDLGGLSQAEYDRINYGSSDLSALHQGRVRDEDYRDAVDYWRRKWNNPGL